MWTRRWVELSLVLIDWVIGWLSMCGGMWERVPIGQLAACVDKKVGLGGMADVLSLGGSLSRDSCQTQTALLLEHLAP